MSIPIETVAPAHRKLYEKILQGERLKPGEGLQLYTDFPLGLLAVLATARKEKASGREVYFNKNFHIEPTNICIHNCTFCSYHKKVGEEGAWDLSLEEMMKQVREFDQKEVTEVHIVGGVHPAHDLQYYALLIERIRQHRPELLIKAFSAVELDYMFRKSGMEPAEGLGILKDAGLHALPGGGAEIFDEEIRRQICPDKTGSEHWLEIHRQAHRLGITSNATILYGHLEKPEHRIDHLERLRRLQDETGGFNAFIPLKFKKKNNPMEFLGEVPVIEDLRNFAVSRLYLDNFPHLKAYWPMIGREVTQLSLSFGVDDIDGTIEDTTKIYSMAGAEDQNPSLSVRELVDIIRQTGYIPVERDTLYRKVRSFDGSEEAEMPA